MPQPYTATSTTRTTTTKQGDTLSAICWAVYGRSSGIMEQVIAANPHLAHHSTRAALSLPAGITITLPEVSAPTSHRGLLQLWT